MVERMKAGALGFSVHSGWAALVAVVIEERFPLLLLRERPHLVKTFTFEFRQPYHTAQKKTLEEARDFIAQVRAEAGGLADYAIQSVRAKLQILGCELRNSGHLASSAKPLPELPRILASHALIHTADGELFREALLDACRRQGLFVLIVKESELLERACREMHLPAEKLVERLAELGRAHGSPWTKDEKFATLAACLSLL
jgi:hypothetical protein